MVALLASNIKPKTTNPSRPPLVPSDPDNAREVTSSYMSPSSSNPSRSRWSANLDFKFGNGDVSSAQKMLITSARSLSVSFQGEPFSLQVSKVKQTPGKGAAQHRWPGRSRQPVATSRSVDFSDERRKMVGSGIKVKALPNSMIDDRSWCDGGLSSNSSSAEFETAVESDHPAASDTESASSGSSSGLHDCGVAGVGCGRRAPRGIVVPARFWQETNNRVRRHHEPTSKNNGFKSPSLTGAKKLAIHNPSSSPRLGSCTGTRGQSSPIRGPFHPSKLAMTTPPRGIIPSRVNNTLPGMINNTLSNRPSILSFSVDVRRGKIGENRIADAHQLRLLYNRVMQWRFVNARAESSLSSQKLNAEKSLYTAWVSTSKLRESVRAKRIELQLLRQNLKLISILKGQMAFLEDWALIDHNYSTSLFGAMEALRASTLRLPVVDCARADIQEVKDAISSAVDVMQAMAPSICLLLPKVDEVQSLVSELANISAKECGSINQCKDLLSMVACMQVKDCSLRTHILQQKCLPSSLATHPNVKIIHS